MNTLGLLFSGQGAQAVGMGHSLYSNSDTAKRLFDAANDILGFDLKQACFEGPVEVLTQTSVCQPALYVHGYVIFSLLKERGMLEGLKVTMGNSLGELTALAAAGAVDFETGLRLVAERGRLMQAACEATQGGMAAVIGGEVAEVQALCHDFDIDISNVNSPGQMVISGERTKIEAAVLAGKDRGFKRIIPLNVAGAYHSRLMEPARVAFEAYLAGFKFNEPQLTVFTNVTGAAVTNDASIKAMLVAQIVSTVEWVKCMESASQAGVTAFIECGPGGVLTGLARRIDSALSVRAVAEWDDIVI